VSLSGDLARRATDRRRAPVLLVLVALTAAGLASASSAMRSAGAGRPTRSLTAHISGTTYTSNAEWTVANSPYVLDGDVTVASGATLTIDPGVVVKLNGQFRTLSIAGTLSAVGTSSAPITFTSYQDDSAGGDSNGDGTATSGAPGQWRMLAFTGSGSELDHVIVRNGGSGFAYLDSAVSVSGTGASVSIDHSEITDNEEDGLYLYNRATATVTHSSLSNNGNGVMANQATVLIDQSTIDDNDGRGVIYNLPTSTPYPDPSTITSSEITGNNGIGVDIGANGDYPLASMPTGTGNNIYANNSSGTQLAVSGFTDADVNWRGNYWGDGVYFWYSPAICGGTSPNTQGHLAYRSSSGNVPAGPIASGSYYVQQGFTTYWCGYDNFSLDPTDFSPTELDADPHEWLGQTFGESNGKNTTQLLADPVDSATGNFKQEQTDLSLPSAGVPFSFTRSYNSLDLSRSELGQGWTDNLSASLVVRANGDVTARGGDGQQEDYSKQGDGSFLGAPGATSILTAVAGGYDLAQADQIVYHFNSQGRLASIVDRNNKGVTLTYGTDGTLAAVTDAAGRDTTFTHTGGLLTAVALPDSSTVSYGYTNGVLTSYTDPRGKVWTYSYDAHGFLAGETDPLSHTQFTNTYGDDGRVSQQTDALSHTTSFAWDPSTQTETVTDPNSHVWKDVYANNVLTQRIDPAGDTTTFVHNTSLDNTSVTAPAGGATTMTYDSRGNLLTATAPASLGSAEKTFTYDSQNNVSTVTDATGKLTSYGYDSAGNTTSVSLDGTQTAGYTYNSDGQILTSTDGNGKTTTNTYDSNGNLDSVTDPLGNETTYTYDTKGRVLAKVDPLGNCSGCAAANYTTTYTYNANGDLLTETDQLGHTTTYTYDDAGRKTSVTDANGHTTSYAYDNANHLTQVTGPDPDGAGSLPAPVTTYAYDAAGNKLTQVDPRGNVSGATAVDYTTTYTYNSNNQLTSTTTPTGDKTTYSYDANGNLTSTVDPRGNVTGGAPADYTTTYTYDAAGRQLTSTDPLGHTTTSTYDDVGNLETVDDANNHTTSYTYDAAGRIRTVTAPDSGVTTYTYDGNGQQLTRTDDNNHTTTNAYNDGGQLTQVTGPDPDGGGSQTAPVTTYAYDRNGNQLTTVDPKGNATGTSGDGTTAYSYDRANRLIGVDYSDSTPDVSYAYDADGNRTSMTDGAGTVTYSYDNENQLTSASRGSDTFSYAYDPAGDITTRTYPDSTTTTYTYDHDNRLATTASGGNTTSYAYNPAGQLTTTTLPSGNGYTETRSYDKAGRLTEVKNATASSTLTDFTQTLDPVGNPTQILRSGATSETATYSYDANDRLTGVCYQMSCPNSNDPYIRWTYDTVGNRLTETRPSGTTTYTYNDADELTAAGSTNYSYDQNGNQTAAGSRSFTYDLANRLATATLSSTTTTYSYDGDGSRLQASTGTGASQKTNYLWDTNAVGGLPQLALERDGNNTLLRRYIYGNRRITMTSSSNAYYYHYDPIGSVINLTNASGTTQWSYSYEPYGGIRTETQNDPAAPKNPMRFAGELADGASLYYLRARQYDAAVGRFLQHDPAINGTSDRRESEYSYVGGAPTVMIDPSGMTFTRSSAAPDLARQAAGPDAAIASRSLARATGGSTSPFFVGASIDQPEQGGNIIAMEFAVDIWVDGVTVEWEVFHDYMLVDRGDFEAARGGTSRRQKFSCGTGDWTIEAVGKAKGYVEHSAGDRTHVEKCGEAKKRLNPRFIPVPAPRLTPTCSIEVKPVLPELCRLGRKP
jgi:RHS repeat-associated protein